MASVSCHDEIEFPPETDIASGGGTTVYGEFITIFEQPAANLSASQVELHRLSDIAFGDQFVTAPATINGGLGPLFNQDACESCHTSNGRSGFPDHADNMKGLLLRLSVSGAGIHGEPVPAPGFGAQLQTKAVFGKPREAQVNWHFESRLETFPDGYEVELVKPVFTITDTYIALPADLMYSPRIAPPVIGLGLIEAIPASAITALADPDDHNGDGISGRPNEVWDVSGQKKSLGRFGWKAGHPTLLQQTAAAYQQDMGVTNPIFQEDNCKGQIQCDTLTDDPEIDLATLHSAAFYPMSLAVPARRNADDPAVRRGKILFSTIQCSDCHHPSFVTGQHDYDFLSDQVIFPYTDLLLHDMGEGLADGRPDFAADGNEWRTPPLWGIGLTKVVGGHSRFLHDGRARNLEEAILWHGGEAFDSKQSYKHLTKADREALVAFLESL